MDLTSGQTRDEWTPRWQIQCNELSSLTAVVNVHRAHTRTHRSTPCRCHSRHSEGQSFFDYSPHCRGSEGKRFSFVFVDFFFFTREWELWEKTKVRRAVKVHRWLAWWRVSSFPGAARQPRTSPLAFARQLKYESTSSQTRFSGLSRPVSPRCPLEVSSLLFCSIHLLARHKIAQDSAQWSLLPVLSLRSPAAIN